MLNVYTVAFFGSRSISDYPETDKRLRKAIKELLCEHEYVEFLVGRHGEFDIMAASAVRTVKREYRDDNSSLILILPYVTAEYRNNKKEFLNYYDDVELCEEAECAHRKVAITVRNRKMAERADCIVCRAEHENGGAYSAVLYAKTLQKRIIDLS